MRQESNPYSKSPRPPWSKTNAIEQFKNRPSSYDAEKMNKIRETEYPALKDTIHLDSAAAPAVPLSILSDLISDITRTLYSNPHSRSHSSIQTSLKIDSIRSLILSDLFGLISPEKRSQWELIFTSGATAGTKIVGQAFPWSRKGSSFRYLKESHTSLVGIRGCALAQNASVQSIDVCDFDWEAEEEEGPALFAYGAQDNSTGVRLGLAYGARVKALHPETYLLLDAAAYLSTTVLRLDSLPIDLAPDFIVCSFYKLFGYPTGLGCLLVKKSSSSILLQPSYFGGGTISALSVSEPFWHQSRRSDSSLHEAFEDGTLPFLSIISLGHAISTHNRLFTSHSHISLHTSSLAHFALCEMNLIRHPNGNPIFKHHQAFASYPPALLEPPGATIGFTLLDELSNPIGHVHLDKLATINGFQIRTGGLCNTGVLNSVLGLTDKDRLEEFEKGRVCWDDEEFSRVEEGAIGKPLGMARISFGSFSTIEDVVEWISFLRKYFVALPSSPTSTLKETGVVSFPQIHLSQLMLYPIKSCAGQPLLSSTLTPLGLAFDRSFILVNSNTLKVLSQKQFPRMALVRSRIDLERSKLIIEVDGIKGTWEVDLEETNEEREEKKREEAVGVCGDKVLANRGGKEWEEIDRVLSTFLGVDCKLMRFSSSSGSGEGRHGHFNSNQKQPLSVPILLSNESPFLLISKLSVNQVDRWIESDQEVEGNVPINPDCFRANFVLDTVNGQEVEEDLPAFFEDRVDFVKIGTETFSVLGKCRRCLMVCVNQQTGVREREPFSCLAKNRRSKKGRIEFGVHLFWRKELSNSGIVKQGDTVEFEFI